MRTAILLVCCLFASGCTTTLLPKLDKLEPPAELMVPPKPLKIINKPVPPKKDVTPNK